MTAAIMPTGSVRLSHWGTIRARGADAASFLHGQLTNDFERLGLAHARLAGYCTAKGRLLATLVGWRDEPEDVLLACSADLLAPTLKRLSMFVLRAKCKLSDASGEVLLEGLVGGENELGIDAYAPQEVWGRGRQGPVTVIRLPDAQGIQRWLRATVVEPGVALPEASSASGALTLDQWRWLEVMSGVPIVEKATAELFVPQMVNLELVGGVNFQKGCYPGQEIVARAQYRGTVKRRGFVFDVPSARAQAGQEVYAESDPAQPAGTVAMAAPRPGDSGSAVFVELKTAAWHGSPLHLGAADGPLLQDTEQPYPLPLEPEQAA